MKNFAFFVSLTVAASALANALEKRQDPTCVGDVCGLATPITLSAPLSVETAITISTILPGIPLPISTVILDVSVGADISTVIGTTCGTGCGTCVTATDPLPTAISVTVTESGTATVTITDLIPPHEPIATLTVTVPPLGFTGEIPIPTITPPALGVCPLAG